MVGPPLQGGDGMMSRRTGGGGGRRRRRSSVTFWKMKSEGKVLEMSSLMRSRLDSLSASDAPSDRETHITGGSHDGGQLTVSRVHKVSVAPLSLSLIELVSL